MPLSPMMKQYFEIKDQYKDCILMFRLGDFYEMFYDDAKIASRELDLVLTGRDCGEDERAPMCGVPFHSVEGYITKLVSKGYRAAICEQMENPADVKGIVRREVIRVISPGTVTEGGYLEEDRNNFLCSLYANGGGYGVVFADISTGEVHATDIPAQQGDDGLFTEAAGYAPAEVIINKDVPENIINFFRDKFSSLITPADEKAYFPERVKREVEEQFGENAIDTDSDCAYALSALLVFLKITQKIDISYIKTLSVYRSEKYLNIDANTRRNLELCESMRTKEKKGSLLWVLDRTKTSAGARLIRRWIDKPLVDIREIKLRQEAVAELLKDNVTRGTITEELKKSVDTERLLTRIVYGTANARDMLALAGTISLLPVIREGLAKFESSLLSVIFENMDTLEDIGQSIYNTIDDNPPVSLREGGIIKPGASESVDELRKMMTEGKNLIAKIEQYEKERTGIRTLKIGYNKVFGYYIEVSKSFMNSVPDTYIRRQTLVNCERYVTEELKDMESRIIGAKDRDSALEYELFAGLRDHILKSKERIQKVSALLALTDTLCSLAESADENNYTCPEVDYTEVLKIKDGRHPVVEKMTKEKYFVPNDCDMDCSSNRTMLITGPNMAGKSTYMRQVALIVLMAQIGSFVPAAEARVGITDNIFTRIGASDDLSSGDSTFMLEMKEVAFILSNATRKSLIIYDEIGRGTSTFDGMSIARAVLEYTNDKICAKTLFATHYHELTDMEDDKKGIKNYNIAAKKRGGDIIFLRKIVRGGTDDSYGIEVASLAGVPSEVVGRAKKVLKSLEETRPSGQMPAVRDDDNISFMDVTESSIREKITELDVNTLTPIEAISILYELKKELD